MREHTQTRATSKTAIYAVCSSVVVILALAGLKRLIQRDTRLGSPQVVGATAVEPIEALKLPVGYRGPLLPVVELTIADASMETSWSAALATLLHGETEAPVEGGRVDVLTSLYAIEVDRLDKWHEGIGQAAHYGLLTKAIPVVAIIVPSDNWPLSETTCAKLMLIDKTCSAQNAKLILLRSADK
jgi:hypothetical protein